MRKLSLLISLIFIFTVITSVAYGEDSQSEKVVSDNISAEFLKAYKISDPVIDKTADYHVKRSEFLKTIVSILQYIDDDSSNVPFSDASAELKGELRYAIDIGMISETTEFRPSDPVTYNEAIKMCVSALGYDYLAGTYGGWPAGYLRVAKDINLIDNINISEIQITPSSFYSLIYNFLLAEMLEAEGVHNGDISYRKYTNILNQYYEMYEIEGVVNANKNSGLYNVSNSINHDAVVIDEYIYPCKYVPPVGYRVKAFVTLKDNKISVLSLYENNLSQLKFEDIIKADENKVEYIAGDKTSSLRLDKEIAYMYNGKADDTCIVNNYIDKIGNAVFVDNDGDNVYEVCYVNEDFAVVVDGVNVADSYISDKNGEKRLMLDEVTYEITMNGQAISLSDIGKGSLVTYNMSKDGLYCLLKVHDIQKSGKYTQYSAEAKKIYIDDVPYKYSTYFEKYYLSGLELGMDVSVLVSDDNVVYALATETKSLAKYGYFIDVMSTNKGLEEKLVVKLLDSAGNISMFEASEKLVIDGYKCNGLGDVYSKFFASSNDKTKLKNEGIVKYLIDGDEKLKLLDFADATGVLNGSEEIDNSLTLWPYPPSGQKDEYGVVHDTTWYNRSTHIIHPHVAVSTETVVILANSDTSVDENERFKITDRSWFSLGNNRGISRSKIKLYDVDSYGVAGAIVMDVATNAQTGNNSAMGVVFSCGKALDFDGIECYKFVVYHNSEYNEYFAYDDATIVELNPGEESNANTTSLKRFEEGDLVMLEAGSQGTLKVIRELYDCRNDNIYSTISNHGEFNIYYGKVYSIGNGILSILPMNDGLTGDPDKLRYTFPAPSKVIIYDSDLKNIYTSDVSGLDTYLQVGDECSKAIIATDSGNSPSYIIYK